MTNESPHILIVDDSEDSADITAAYLQDGGFGNVSFARSAAEAYEMMGMDGANSGRDRSPAPDFALVIMDIVMPEIDGIEACARIRVDPEFRHVPILMLSAARDRQALNQAFVAGANDFVSKPVGEIDLLARVRTLLRFRREQRRRQIRELELRNVNDALQREKIDDVLIDPVTRLASGMFIELRLRACRENGIPAALALLQIDAFAAYSRRFGATAADQLVAQIGSILKGASAPLLAQLCYYGEGSFMIVQPEALDDRALSKTCKNLAAAVSASKIPHGASLRSDSVTFSTTIGWAQGEELSTLPARLLADARTTEGE